MLVAGEAAHAAFDLRDGAGQLDEVDLAGGCGHGIDGVADEVRADGGLGVEGKDHSWQVAVCSLVKDGEPELLAQGDKLRAAEFEDGEQQVHNQMVMKEAIAGDGSQFLGDGEFADCRHAVDEDQLHADCLPIFGREVLACWSWV